MKKFYSLLLCALLAAASLVAQNESWQTLYIPSDDLWSYFDNHTELKSAKKLKLQGLLDNGYGCNILNHCPYLEIMDLRGLTNKTLDFGWTNQPTSRIKKIILNDNLTDISPRSFEGIPMQTIVMTSSIKKIGANAFRHCDGLKKVYITNLTSWCGIDFHNCASNPLHNNAVLYLNNEPVVALEIPDGVTNLKPYQFCGGKFLSISIPKSVKKVDCTTFGYVYQLENLKMNNMVRDIYVYAAVPPELDGYLEGIDLDNTVLHVPAEVFNEYKKASGWCWFKRIVPIGKTTTIRVSNNNASNSSETTNVEIDSEDIKNAVTPFLNGNGN